jgi:hypothetical protein
MCCSHLVPVGSLSNRFLARRRPPDPVNTIDILRISVMQLQPKRDLFDSVVMFVAHYLKLGLKLKRG